MSDAAGTRRVPLFDPEAVPHDPSFGDAATRGAAVPLERLRPAALRQRFTAPVDWQPELRADPRLFMPDLEPRPAAVLIPLVVRGGEVSVLLTQRTDHLHDHAGQISFPGGSVEQHDVDAKATALREADEEIGLSPDAVDVVGELPEYVTVTGFRVTPVVALVERPFRLKLDAFEVSEVFEVPLPFLMNPAHHERRVIALSDMARTFYAMPYQAGRRYFIWGATAAMLRNLYHFLRA
jgi:8-oxo-dGTP pyrophosphatase MutT (NUDIX family)